MKAFVAATVLALVFLPLRAQTDPGWPREMDSGGRHYTIYQPQVDRWRDDRLDARAVVTVTEQGAATQPVYGIVSLSARTSVDKVTRTVTLEDPKAESAVFPAASGRQSELLGAIRASLPDWPRVISLDRLLADLAITQSETAAESVPLKSDVPRIIFSTAPAVLVLIDGDPVLRRVQGTRYTRVINTPALLVFDSGENRYYLDGQTFWMTAASLNGPWSVAPAPPADLDSLRNQVDQTEEKEPGAPAPGPSPAQGGVAPSVYVSTVPAELVQTDGQPQYAPIAGTKLSYVTNTESDIFLDVGSQSYFVLLSGRWFQAKSLNGPWSWLAGQQLPAEFSGIPLNSPKSGVLASVPETPQAREAIIANQVPQTATVKRNEARLDVRYDGPPSSARSPARRCNMR